MAVATSTHPPAPSTVGSTISAMTCAVAAGATYHHCTLLIDSVHSTLNKVFIISKREKFAKKDTGDMLKKQSNYVENMEI